MMDQSERKRGDLSSVIGKKNVKRKKKMTCLSLSPVMRNP